MPVTRKTSTSARQTGGITPAMLSTARRAATSRSAPAGAKGERESVMACIKHQQQDAVAVILMTPEKRLVCSSMKISSLSTTLLNAHSYARGGKLPDGFRPDDSSFSTEPGKNNWAVAVYRLFQAGAPLWLLPKEGIVISSEAAQKFYGMRNEKGMALAREYFDTREEVRKKMEGDAYRGPSAFPRSQEELEMPKCSVELTELSRRPNFPELVAALVRTTHSLTATLSCRILTEDSVAREPIMTSSFNEFLSPYVSEAQKAVETRTSGNFQTLLHVLRTIRGQLAENARLPGQPTAHKFTVFEIFDSNTQENGYTVRFTAKSARDEGLSSKKEKGLEKSYEKRLPIWAVLSQIQPQTAASIRTAVEESLREEARKTAAANGTPPETIGQEQVHQLLSNVFLTHIAVALPNSQRTSYPAARATFRGHGTQEITPDVMAATMTYFFLRRYKLEGAAQELFDNEIVRDVFTGIAGKAVFEHLSQYFGSQKVSTGRGRGHTYTGFDAAAPSQLRDFNHSAEQARLSAHAASRRSPSPGARAAPSAPWTGAPAPTEIPSGTRAWVPQTATAPAATPQRPAGAGGSSSGLWPRPAGWSAQGAPGAVAGTWAGSRQTSSTAAPAPAPPAQWRSASGGAPPREAEGHEGEEEAAPRESSQWRQASGGGAPGKWDSSHGGPQR